MIPPAKVRLEGYQLKTSFSDGLAVVQRPDDLALGFVDAAGIVAIPPRFQDAGRFSEGLAAAREEYRAGFGYVDRTGRMVIPPGWDAALPFSEGLAAVLLDGRWGFVDRTGAVRIPPRFDDASPFREGRARIVVDGLAGFVDAAGKAVIAPAWFRAGGFREGLAAVCDRSRCGFVDLDGAVAIPLEYDDAGALASGVAPVRVGEKWGYVDRKGRMALAPAYDEAEPFAEGLARVGIVKDATFDTKFGGYSGRTMVSGFIDPSGNWVFEPKMLGATSFSGGFAAIRLPTGGLCSDCYEYRFMAKDGSFLPGRFDMVRPFSEGLAVVARSQKSRVIDGKGTPLLELGMSYLEDETRSPGPHVPHRFGFVDVDGTPVLPHRLLSAQP
ncbi:WG repeat-containing protein, partial [bacterium]|nr:WG repeat-containing protein [bacterium]